MPFIGRFLKVGIVVLALVIGGMLALEAFSIRVPVSSESVTTVDGVTIITTCSWRQTSFDNLRGCTTTRTRRK